MITIKSAREIELMRLSGKITAKTLSMLMQAVQTRHDDRRGRSPRRGLDPRRWAAIPTFIGYNGYKHAICTSVNDEVVHGIPGTRVLREGDLLSIDIGTTLEGYVSDSRRDGADRQRSAPKPSG